MAVRRNWKKTLNPQERSQLKELDRQIKKAREEEKRRNIKEHLRLKALKWDRKMLQNRVSVRARRLEEQATA